ncbi:MAG: NADH-quinone oxidoreductase subunit J [Armatimonadota bacterium]
MTDASPVLQHMVFWPLAVWIVATAIGVVRLRSIVRSAACLMTCFVGIGGLYLVLHAEFVFAIQILVYGGGIMVLILFAVLLLQRAAGEELRHHNEHGGLALGVAIGFLCMFGWFVVSWGMWNAPGGDLPEAGTLVWTGRQFLGRYILPFEVISVALLVAMVGAIIIARTRGPER